LFWSNFYLTTITDGWWTYGPPFAIIDGHQKQWGTTFDYPAISGCLNWPQWPFFKGRFMTHFTMLYTETAVFLLNRKLALNQSSVSYG
jgi:hypothetical protein